MTSDLYPSQDLGSAKKGLFHWIAQRVTAIALIPLGLWFVVVFIVLLRAPFEQAYLWFSSPWAVTFAVLFIFNLFYHGYLGMRVIWEDYIPHERTRWIVLLSTQFLSAFLALLTIVCILRIYLR